MSEYKFDEMQNDEGSAPVGDQPSEEQGAPVEETPMEAPAEGGEAPAEGGDSNESPAM